MDKYDTLIREILEATRKELEEIEESFESTADTLIDEIKKASSLPPRDEEKSGA